MAKDLLPILRNIGLDEKEAHLYVAGLQLGSAPASEYARACDLNRITSYNTLESLVKRGLFTLEKKIRGKSYAPVSPDSLAVEAEKHLHALTKALPELKSLQKAKYRKPNVRFFEGWEGVKRVYQDTLTSTGELLNFANSAVVREHWPEYDDEYVAERVRRNIRLRGISPDDAAGRQVHGEDKTHMREIRLVPANEFDFTNEINIYDHKVAICSFDSGLPGDGDMFGIIIESKEVAETQRQIFEMAWRYAGR
jgi:sugar-specific transcriptional regulator TrmB